MNTKVLLIGMFGLLLLIAVALLGLIHGSTYIPLHDVWHALLGKTPTPAHTILYEHRIPRVCMALLGGGVLATTGLTFQTILRNPLAEPYILGVSGGAAVGTIICLLLGLSRFQTNMGAFGISLVALFFVLYIGKTKKQSLLLAGVMINAFCGAIILFLLSLAKPNEMGQILFWFMGNIGAVPQEEVGWYICFFAPLLGVFLCFGHYINILSLGKDTAQSLGVSVKKNIYFLLILASLQVSVLTAAVGPLGFVGLVIPQGVRLLVGQDNRMVLPLSLICGATFLTLCDIFARTLPPHGEMPVGVLTALIGAPAFIFLLRRHE